MFLLYPCFSYEEDFLSFQVVIPISLYVSIEIVKLGQVYFITQDKEMYHEETDSSAECRALNITEDLGQVSEISLWQELEKHQIRLVGRGGYKI